MVSTDKGKRRIKVFVILNVILVVSFVLFALLSDWITPLDRDVESIQAILEKTQHEYKTLSQKIEDNEQSLQELSKENIQGWFNAGEDKYGD